MNEEMLVGVLLRIEEKLDAVLVQAEQERLRRRVAAASKASLLRLWRMEQVPPPICIPKQVR